MEKAMGGREEFDAQHLLIFEFTVERGGTTIASWLHFWDRATGRYRLEGMKDGAPLRVIMNLNDRTGKVWRGSTPLTDAQAKPLLDFAYGRFINDSYWFLMPWKWRDPGVVLSYDGEKTRDGETFDVVHLSFDPGIGLTSRDQYWAWVSRADGLMKHWEYLLQTEDGKPGTGDHTEFTWKDWETVTDHLRFSARKVKEGGGPEIAIAYPVLQAFPTAPDSLFNPPPPPGGAYTLPPATPR
jgi:hypothetical protein